MQYIKRDMEDTLLRLSRHFKAVLVTGPRQVGKTTMMRKLMEGTGRGYVSLDDIALRELAGSDPKTFIAAYPPPVFIDEVQYAPGLFTYIKMAVDGSGDMGGYWLSGSQAYGLMRGVRESLAGRVGLLDMLPLSQNEIFSHRPPEPFRADFVHLGARMAHSQPKATPHDIYSRIFLGGMPSLVCAGASERGYYYDSFVRTYLERDVRDISKNIDLLKFHRFLTAAAARCGQIVNFKAMADDAEIDQATAKNWMGILETMGLVFFLHPYANNLLKRAIKSPKLYFHDSGLVAFLCRWSSAETLMNGAQAGAILENYAIGELVKSYRNSGVAPYIYYYRDRDGKEIDVVMESDGALSPIEIKKTSTPDRRLTNAFKALGKSGMEIGSGGVLCLTDELVPFDALNTAIPVSCI